MKPILAGISVCLSISTMIFSVSCVKSTSPGGGVQGPSSPSDSSYLSSISGTSRFSSLADSFTYDNTHRVLKITISGSDASGHSSGSANVAFSYSGSNTVPASYTINNPDQTSVLHQLSYDGQNRIIKDSSLDGKGFVTYWSYPNGNIVSVMKGLTNGELIDTLFLSSGNVTEKHSYSANSAGTLDTLISTTQYTYTSISNPCYHQAIASTYGPLLTNLVVYDGATDFVSTNGISTLKTEFLPLSGLHGFPGSDNPQTFAWTTDSKGRAATLKVNDPTIGTIGNFTFTYY